MKITILLLAITLMAVSLMAKSAHATQGERNGLLFGFGIGWGNSSVDDPLWEKTNPGSALNVKVGFAPTNRVMLYLVSLSQHMSRERIEGDFVSSNALGASWFLEPEARSLFFTASLGASKVNSIEGMSDSPMFGGSLGVGYEFIKHFTLEAYTWQSLAGETGARAYTVTINWLAY